MAVCVKCFLALLLLVVMLSLLTVSSSAEDVKVTFLVEQRLEYNGVLLISGNCSALTPSQAMTLTPNDVWVLTVTLTKGEPCEYYLKSLPQGSLYECICSFGNNTALTVPGDYPLPIYPEILIGYDCNLAACPYNTQGKSRDGIRQVV